MAVSITVKKRGAEGSAKVAYVDITGPASYTTGGETLSASDLKTLIGDPSAVIGDIDHFDAEVTNGGHTLFLDRTNSKILFFNGTTQITAATNLSTFTARVRVAKSFKP